MKSYKRGSRGYQKSYSYSSVTPRRQTGKIITLLVILIITIFIVLFAYTLFSGKSPFAGFKISYGDPLTDSEREFIESAVEGLEPESNIAISASDNLENGAHVLIYDAFLPTTDFYDPRSDVSPAEVENWTSIKDLSPEDKVLSLDGEYYFDTFSSGAKFRTLTFDGDNPDNIMQAVKKKLNLPDASSTLSLTQTGVTALTRSMNDQLAKVGDATYFSADVRDFLRQADFTHLSNEVSFADDCRVSSESTTLCSPSAMLNVIKDVDADIIELTGNHNNDYGASANLDTIKTYHDLNIQTFGGGKDEDSAKKPLEVSSKNTNLTLLGYNYSTSTKANGQGADGDSPGANIYDEKTAAADIQSAKDKGDFVIVDVQYFECYAYPDDASEYPACDAPISGQEEFFKHLIDLGADIVIGTQAHQPQTYELYHGKPIYYGLGNLFFDQTYWPGTTRGYILTHYFHNGKYLQTRLTPHQYDNTYQTHLMDEETSRWFLNRLDAARAE